MVSPRVVQQARTERHHDAHRPDKGSIGVEDAISPHGGSPLSCSTLEPLGNGGRVKGREQEMRQVPALGFYSPDRLEPTTTARLRGARAVVNPRGKEEDQQERRFKQLTPVPTSR